MSSLPSDSLGSYLPESVTLPDDQKERDQVLKDLFESTARMVNRKDTGSYEEVEQLTNQQFFGATPQEKRYVYRRVYDIGAIAAGATLNTPHGLTNVTEYVRMYGTCVTAVVDYRPLPRVSMVNINQQISLDVVGVNIVIINGAGSPNITSGLVVLEYLKN